MSVHVENASGLCVGDYFADTLQLSAIEHHALGRLLMQMWVNEKLAITDDNDLASAALLEMTEWLDIKPIIFPLVVSAAPRISARVIELKAFQGKSLPPSVWQSVRAIVLLRDQQATNILRHRCDAAMVSQCYKGLLRGVVRTLGGTSWRRTAGCKADVPRFRRHLRPVECFPWMTKSGAPKAPPDSLG